MTSRTKLILNIQMQTKKVKPEGGRKRGKTFFRYSAINGTKKLCGVEGEWGKNGMKMKIRFSEGHVGNKKKN